MAATVTVASTTAVVRSWSSLVINSLVARFRKAAPDFLARELLLASTVLQLRCHSARVFAVSLTVSHLLFSSL
jgi:hypothetical protein